MSVHEVLDSVLAELQPVLETAGRKIVLKEANEHSCTIELVGFCGACACTDSYMEGLQERLAEKAPEVKDITFIQS